MATVAEVVKRALSLINVQPSEAAIQPDEAQSAIITMNYMLASWEGGGIVLGYTPVTTLGDVLTVPDNSLNGISSNLAIELSPEFGGNVSPILVQNARYAKQELLRANRVQQTVKYPCTVPMGSGNTGTGRNLYNGPFYPCTADEVI